MTDIKNWHKRRENLERRLRKMLEANPVDVVAFNAQREKLKAMGSDDFCNGQKLYLRNVVCPNINLEQTYFEKLDNVSLDHARLRGANFDYVMVKDTSFRHANLRDAAYLLTKVSIAGTVDFSYADLRGVRLDIDYRGYVERIIYGSIFKETRITPDQEQQLMRKFGIHPQYMVGRFQIIPSE